jgi:hypothetical protein
MRALVVCAVLLFALHGLGIPYGRAYLVGLIIVLVRIKLQTRSWAGACGHCGRLDSYLHIFLAAPRWWSYLVDNRDARGEHAANDFCIKLVVFYKEVPIEFRVYDYII